MDRIKLSSFELEEYDSGNPIHQEYAKRFENDEDYCEYMEPFWSLENSVKYESKKGKYTAVYFAYTNGVLVGMVGLIWIDSPELVVGILKEYRGNHYSRYLCQEYADYILEAYQEYEALYAYIHPENTHSIENVLAAGFKQIDEIRYVKRR